MAQSENRGVLVVLDFEDFNGGSLSSIPLFIRLLLQHGKYRTICTQHFDIIAKS
jgi:hypothetical protein